MMRYFTFNEAPGLVKSVVAFDERHPIDLSPDEPRSPAYRQIARAAVLSEAHGFGASVRIGLQRHETESGYMPHIIGKVDVGLFGEQTNNQAAIARLEERFSPSDDEEGVQQRLARIFSEESPLPMPREDLRRFAKTVRIATSRPSLDENRVVRELMLSLPTSERALETDVTMMAVAAIVATRALTNFSPNGLVVSGNMNATAQDIEPDFTLVA